MLAYPVPRGPPWHARMAFANARTEKKDMTGSTEANYLHMSIHENLWGFFYHPFFFLLPCYRFISPGTFEKVNVWMKSTNWLWVGFCASVGRKRSDRRSVGPPKPGENHIGRKCSVGICWVLEGWQDLINISARSYKVWGFIKFHPQWRNSSCIF